jgi:hypothetical protein
MVALYSILILLPWFWAQFQQKTRPSAFRCRAAFHYPASAAELSRRAYLLGKTQYVLSEKDRLTQTLLLPENLTLLQRNRRNPVKLPRNPDHPARSHPIVYSANRYGLPSAPTGTHGYCSPYLAGQEALPTYGVVSVEDGHQLRTYVTRVNGCRYYESFTSPERIDEKAHIIVYRALAGVFRAVVTSLARSYGEITQSQNLDGPSRFLERLQRVLQENMAIASLTRTARNAKYVHLLLFQRLTVDCRLGRFIRRGKTESCTVSLEASIVPRIHTIFGHFPLPPLRRLPTGAA